MWHGVGGNGILLRPARCLGQKIQRVPYLHVQATSVEVRVERSEQKGPDADRDTGLLTNMDRADYQTEFTGALQELKHVGKTKPTKENNNNAMGSYGVQTMQYNPGLTLFRILRSWQS